LNTTWPKRKTKCAASSRSSRCVTPNLNRWIAPLKEIAGDVEREDKEVLDAALIAAAQAIEHYEITRYGSLISWAGTLGRDDCASVLGENLKEEKAADEKLAEIAESEVNAEASAA
jgi:ferritin-like metal-binding protein YciE